MLSPIYFFLPLCIFILVIFILNRWAIKMDGNFIFGAFLIVYSIFIYPLVTDYGTYFNFVLSGIVILLLPSLLSSMTSIQYSVNVWVLLGIISLYVVEAIYRILNPIVYESMLEKQDESLMFYQYKYNSIMFLDSNFVAFSLISLLFIVDSFFHNEKLKRFFIITICILMMSTFSRAGCISLIVYLFVKHATRSQKIYLLILMAILASFVLPIILSDGSYLSKLDIIDSFLIYFEQADVIMLLFGVGVGRAIDFLHIGAHNIFVLLNVEFGFIAFIWYCAFVFFNVYKSKYKTVPYWIAINLCGFSLGVIYPFVFFAALLPAYLHTRKCR
ncbi:hypothetical protein [Vibrio cholerae]|uniref:hypothetical protein n=3 Tax=Vibrio cholerae TaxID=666 RepID=UPI0028D96DE0|nr:hypothetical protein [Vibrio cholerae]MEB5553979.1 hypothetical protein [Vibrio cholerae]HDZ9289755.1 hypothetical protein [Vibrio cholerae]